MDVWFTGFLALVNLILGALGGYVSLRTPVRENHWKYFAAFVALGITGVVLTVALAIVNDRGMDGIKASLDGAQRELRDLKKPKRAHFAIVKPLIADNDSKIAK